MKRELPHHTLLSLVEYDQLTGIFTCLYGKRQGKPMETRHGEDYLYVFIRGYGNFIAHRLAFFYMRGYWPPETVGHYNYDRGDNRWENIGPQTHSEQQRDKTNYKKGGALGWPGTYAVHCKTAVRYVSHITQGGKIRRLGRFTTPAASYHAYRQAGGKAVLKSLCLRAEYMEFLLGELGRDNLSQGSSGQHQRRRRASHDVGMRVS